MRERTVICGLLGCLMVHGSGQEDVRGGELRLELAWPPAEPDLRAREAHLCSYFRPTVVMRRMADGSVRSRYVLVHSAEYGKQSEDEAALALADAMAACLKTGELQAPGHGIRVTSPSEEALQVRCGDLGDRTVPRELAGQVAAMIRETRKRAKAFVGADFGLRREAIRKLEGPVLEGWSISLELGSVELEELGGRQDVWWRGGVAHREQDLWFGFWLEGDRRISSEMFEALGRVPAALTHGKSVRWEHHGEMLRAFAENKAIFYRPETRMGEDLRISLETAQEAWKMLEKRDRLAEWLAAEVLPGVQELTTRGR